MGGDFEQGNNVGSGAESQLGFGDQSHSTTVAVWIKYIVKTTGCQGGFTKKE